MHTEPSKIVIGTLEMSPPGMAPLFPFGDRDDPQRLVVLLAGQVAARLPDDAEIEKKTRVCFDPRAAWRKRRLALEDALTLAAEQLDGHVVALADIDALAPLGTEDWSADRSLSMRRDLYQLVLDAVERGGWIVFRTCPAKSVSSDLARLEVAETYASEPASVGTIDQANPFAPEVRPIAAWLVQRGVLRPRDLSHIIADVAEFDAHIVDLAYDVLTPDARDAGKILSAVRPPQHVNGALGSFRWADTRPTATTIPRCAADALRMSGFLQPTTDPTMLRMPRLVRDLLRRVAVLGAASTIRQVHKRLARRPIEAESTAEQVEIHHHAVLARDVELAKSTARFYGTELRDLATQFGLEAQREHDRKTFGKAAELFNYVVTNFDSTDAYAWEYLGYNLARTGDVSHRPRIRQAYEKAHHLWRDNPLYHGRWLGFRGELGEEIVAEVTSWVDRYVNKFGDEQDAVSFFAEAALKGLRRGRQMEQLERIVAQKRPLLERFAPRALTSVADDE